MNYHPYLTLVRDVYESANYLSSSEITERESAFPVARVAKRINFERPEPRRIIRNLSALMRRQY